MPLSNHTLLKYIILVDLDIAIFTHNALKNKRDDYPLHKKYHIVICESVSIEYVDGGIGISYWLDNKPVYREYTGRYDFIQSDVMDYSVEDWKREQALGLHRPAGRG